MLTADDSGGGNGGGEASAARAALVSGLPVPLDGANVGGCLTMAVLPAVLGPAADAAGPTCGEPDANRMRSSGTHSFESMSWPTKWMWYCPLATSSTRAGYQSPSDSTTA